MDISFYVASVTSDSESVVQSVEVSDSLYEKLAESDFSKIGFSKSETINIDGEMVETELVVLTRAIRHGLECSLTDLLISMVADQVAEGEGIPKKKYVEYLANEGALVQLIQALRDNAFTHLGRA